MLLFLKALAASGKVISLVGMQLVGSLARTPTRRLADRFDGIDCLFQYLGVVNVGSRVDHSQRDASPIYHNMALRALLSLICRVRAGLLAPRGAATLAASNEALSHSIWSASPKRFRSF
jgi:hypothetical protein